jgi:hypothetical protein
MDPTTAALEKEHEAVSCQFYCRINVARLRKEECELKELVDIVSNQGDNCARSYKL